MKLFVIMTEHKGRLVCIAREGGYSAGQSIAYGYKMRSAASRFAAKTGGDVYSIQGQGDFCGLRHEADHHDLAIAAEREFNPVRVS